MHKEIVNLIERGKTKESLDLLSSLSKGKPEADSVSLLFARYNELQNKIINNTISSNNASRQNAKINKAVLEISNLILTNNSENKYFETDIDKNRSEFTASDNQKQRLIFFGGLTLILLVIGISLFDSKIIRDNFSIYKIVIALASAGIASLIPGVLKIKYKQIISSSGAISVFVLVFLFTPAPNMENTFSIKVFLRPSNFRSITESGQVYLYLGNEVRKEEYRIDDGALFENIPLSFLGDKAKFDINFTEPYEIERGRSDHFRLERDKPIDIPIKLMLRNNITGSVLHGDTPLNGVVVSSRNSRDTTDNLGRYDLEIALQDKLSERIEVQFYKPGYKSLKKEIFLQTIEEVDIIMVKLNKN